MIPIRVTLVPLTETPEKSMGPGWRKEGVEELPCNSGIAVHAEAEGEKESGDPAPR